MALVAGPSHMTHMCDPQTTSCLLVAVAPEALKGLLAAFEDSDEPVWHIGEVTEGESGTIIAD